MNVGQTGLIESDKRCHPGAMIMAVTIAILVGMAADRPPASRLVQTDYCLVDQPVIVKHPLTGKTKKLWVPGYAPCSQQDIYRQI